MPSSIHVGRARAIVSSFRWLTAALPSLAALRSRGGRVVTSGRALTAFTFIGAVGIFTGCADLPDVAANVCGNGIVEAGEDCDSHDVGTTHCRASGAESACRLDCTAAVDGTAASCPAGWGCGSDAICRSPTGTFEAVGTSIEGGADRLLLGDFDGDGRQDILVETRVNGLGQTSARLHYLDANGALDTTLVLRATVSSPSTRDLSNDGLADLSFSALSIQSSAAGLNVLLGQSDRTLAPAAYATFPLPAGSKARLREFDGFMGLKQNAAGQLVGSYFHQSVVTFAHYEDVANHKSYDVISPAGDSSASMLKPIGLLPDSPENLIGDPLAADVVTVDSPCDEMILAFKGATSIPIYQICDETADFVQVDLAHIEAGKPPFPISAVSLDEFNDTVTGVLATHIDPDDHLDLIIGGAKNTYVAFGDGTGTFHKAPMANAAKGIVRAKLDLSTLMGPVIPLGMPLTVQEIPQPDTDTPKTNYTLIAVFPNVLGYVTMSDLTNQLATFEVTSVGSKLSGAWTTARIANLNVDGFVDVVAAADNEQDIDFFNGTPYILFNQVKITTDGPVNHMTVGDVDGDLVNDLIFSERITINDKDRDSISIAFGQTLGGPEDPVRNGNFPSIVQLRNAQFSGEDSAVETGIVFASEDGTSNSIAVLSGSGDRQPLASFGLLGAPLDTGEPSQNTVGNPTAMAVGLFDTDTHPDVVALAYDQAGDSNAPGLQSLSFRFWMTPAKDTADFGTSTYSTAISAAIQVLPSQGEAEQASLSTSLMASDLDNDGVDEVILLSTSYEDGTTGKGKKHPALVIGRSTGGNAASLEPDAPLVIDSLTLRAGNGSDVQAADIDGDGFRDLVVLVLNPGGSESSLFVLWNDGKGHFDATAPTVVASGAIDPGTTTSDNGAAGSGGAAGGPAGMGAGGGAGAAAQPAQTPSATVVRAFTAVSIDADSTPEIVWLTDVQASVARRNKGTPRTLTSSTLASVGGGSAVAAGDLNGDGVLDLAVASKRSTQVFLGVATLR